MELQPARLRQEDNINYRILYVFLWFYKLVKSDAVYDTNVLTVIASESYDDFAKKLQTEIAEACDSRPVVVTATLFAEVTTQTEEGKLIKVTKEQAINIHEELCLRCRKQRVRTVIKVLKTIWYTDKLFSNRRVYQRKK